MTLPISYFRFYFPEYVLKTRLPLNCATGFLDRLTPPPIPNGIGGGALVPFNAKNVFLFFMGKDICIE